MTNSWSGSSTALREAAGLYQADIARAVPCHRTTVTHAEAGSQLPASDFWEIADRVVGADGALIARYHELIHAKAAHLAEQQAQRRARAHATAQQLTAAPPLKLELTSPAFHAREDTQCDLMTGTSGGSSEEYHQDLESILMDAADQSANFLTWVETSNIGELTVEQLHSEIRRIALSYLKAPTLPLFERTRGLRDRAFSLLRGRQKPTHSRDLYSAAGWSLTVLAWMSTDLNHPNAAEEHLRTAWVCAENAEQNNLRAWIRATQHTAAFWQNDFVRAGNYARGGLRYATNGSAELFLASAWGMDMARYGDREGAQRVLAHAQHVAERLHSDEDEVGGPFTCSVGRAGGLWSDTQLALGEAEDALSHANEAISIFEKTSSLLCNLGSERMVRCQQVKSHLLLDELDGVWESLAPVLDTAPQHRVQPLIQRVDEISQMATRFRRGHAPVLTQI
jgi:Helix-turn-helix domain